MSKAKITAIIIALCLILLGISISGAILIPSNFDFSMFATSKTQENTFNINDSFSNINIDVLECDIAFIHSTQEECKVVCREIENINHDVTVENGALTIKSYDNRKWYEHIGIFWEKTQITVYLPAAEYEEVHIKSVSGDISLPSSFTFNNAEIETTSGSINYKANTKNILKLKTVSGDISVSDNNVNTFDCKATSGDISLWNVISASDFTIKTVSGDIELKDCNGANISLKTTSGDVEGSLLSGKSFIVDTTSGDIEIPPSIANGDKCVIKTTSGDIEIDVK